MTILTNALSGSLAAQAALDTTSHNIANLQTKGYTRQGVLLTTLAQGGGGHSPGTGVQVSSLIRFSDAYKSQQLWRAASDLGQHAQPQPYLTQLERVMGDEQSSISKGIDIFFSALNAAGSSASSTPLRQQVITAANAMAQHFNSIYQVMGNQLLSVQQQRSALVPPMNAALQAIATLNQKIAGAGASGSTPSALIDQRDQAIDDLAQHLALEIVDQPDGSRSVSLRSGQPLVIGGAAGSIADSMSATGVQSLTLNFANSSWNLDKLQLGGSIGGLNDFERNLLRPMRQSVADLAGAIVGKVNTQLAAGIDMSGAAGAPLLALNGGGTTLLGVTAGFQAGQLAFSSDGTQGNSDNLQALIGIKSQTINVAAIGNVLISDADTQLVGKLGIDSQQNQALLATAETIRSQAENDWSSTSSVNKDEEAVNLMEYQNMFQANMKVIAVANTLFDATLAMFN